jgi:uncharacterized protein YggE
MITRWKTIAGGLAACAAVGVAVLTVAGTTQPAAATQPPPEPPTTEAPVSGDRVITVGGSGTVRVDPDLATVTLGVEANAPTGEEAMTQVNASSTALTEALVGAGIAEEDIQTSGLSLWSTTDDAGQVTGYHASLSVNVTVRDIDAVGSTIDTAQQAAGEGFTIGGVSFSFADPESVLEQARIDALADARRTAEQYANAAGVTLGDVTTITEHASTPPVLYAAVDQMAAAPEAGPAISPGQLDLTVDITVSYAIS